MPETDVVFHRPETIEAALAMLSRVAPRPAIAVAGGTWVMRAALRGEETDRTFVSLGDIAALRRIAPSDGGLHVGAMVTHATLAGSLGDAPAFAGLKKACAGSANPAIRQRATIGGNLCADRFAAPDLVPALMALGATVVLRSPAGQRQLPVADFLNERATRQGPELVTGVVLPFSKGATAHARALMREAGEYPIAVASVFADRGKDGSCKTLRIAISAVEPAPRRWHGLENALQGRPLDPVAARAEVQAQLANLRPRDGVDAAGWYRVRVLPQLIANAIADLVQRTAVGDPK